MNRKQETVLVLLLILVLPVALVATVAARYWITKTVTCAMAAPIESADDALRLVRSTVLDEPRNRKRFLASGGSPEMFDEAVLFKQTIFKKDACVRPPRFFRYEPHGDPPGTPTLVAIPPNLYTLDFHSTLKGDCPTCRDDVFVGAIVNARCATVSDVSINRLPVMGCRPSYWPPKQAAK